MPLTPMVRPTCPECLRIDMVSTLSFLAEEDGAQRFAPPPKPEVRGTMDREGLRTVILERWRAALDVWRDLRYCRRDNIAFLPGSDRSISLDELPAILADPVGPARLGREVPQLNLVLNPHRCKRPGFWISVPNSWRAVPEGFFGGKTERFIGATVDDVETRLEIVAVTPTGKGAADTLAQYVEETLATMAGQGRERYADLWPTRRPYSVRLPGMDCAAIEGEKRTKTQVASFCLVIGVLDGRRFEFLFTAAQSIIEEEAIVLAQVLSTFQPGDARVAGARKALAWTR